VSEQLRGIHGRRRRVARTEARAPPMTTGSKPFCSASSRCQVVHCAGLGARDGPRVDGVFADHDEERGIDGIDALTEECPLAAALAAILQEAVGFWKPWHSTARPSVCAGASEWPSRA